MASDLTTVEEVLAILKDGTETQDLVGVYEAPWLDFKGTYHLDNLREQWELAKDVAAMARNDDGGVVVVGVQTRKDASRDEEYASKIAPVPHANFDVKRAYDIIERDVYPPIDGLRIDPFPRGDDRRLVAIVVPPQDPDRGPFLLSHFVDEQGQRWNAFALPRRSGSHTSFEPIGIIHRDIADGRRARKLGGGTPAAPGSDAVVHDAEAGASTQDAEAWTIAVATDLDRALGWTEIGVVYISAVPGGPPRKRPPDFFAQDGLRQALSRRDQVRQAGFGLTYGLNITIGAKSLLSIDDDRTVLRLDVDGHVLAGAAGTPEFLGWAQDQYGSSIGRSLLRINHVVVGEYVYEFCRFVTREVAPRWGADGWAFVVLVRRAQTAERPLTLPSGYRPETAWMFDPIEAEADERVEGTTAELNPAIDAARLLETVYGVFGLSVDRSPFITEGRFDEEKLREIGR